MKFLSFFLFLCIYSCQLWGQASDLMNKMKEIYNTSSTDIDYQYGLLDGTLPVAIAYQKNKKDFQGLITYGNNRVFRLIDGHIHDDGIDIYEYEGNAVTSTISSNSTHVSENIQRTWKSQNVRLELPISISKKVDTKKKVFIYGSIAGNTLSQIVLCPSKSQISIEKDNQINLRWMDYSCQGADCIEGRPDEHLENPVEFAINDDHVLLYPKESATLLHEIEYKNISVDSNFYFISYDFPILGQRRFDNWIEKLIAKELEKEYKRLELIVSEDKSPYRFKYQSFGDFYISLVSDEIISGYLILRASNHNKLRTIPFNYDLDKKRFYQIKDIFKKDFDYPYFLKANIEKQKRNLLYKESGVVKQLISEAPFSHMVLSPSGLIFFTDFNSIFGRRHVVIPFENLKTFVGDKSISKYIQKERFK